MDIQNGAASMRQETEYDLQEQLGDFWCVVRRHWGVVLVSLAVAIALGCLYYLKAPRTYESTTEILIATKHVNVFQGEAGEDRPIFEKSIETHALMIRSELIVNLAIQAAKLDKLPTLRDEENPTVAIIENLSVAVREENTTILLVRYTGASPEDCQKVVHAISDAYQDFLLASSQGVDNDMAKLIKEANDVLEQELGTLSKQYNDFRREADVMWQDGHAVNYHHQRQSQIEQMRHAMIVEREVLNAKIEGTQEAISQGGVSLQAVYYTALNELNPDDEEKLWRNLRMSEHERYAEREAVRSYVQALTSEYINLLISERQMQEEYGEGHHDLESIRNRIATIKRMLRTTLENKDGLERLVAGMDVEEAESNIPAEQDYVSIYMQKMRDDLGILDRQIERLSDEFNAAQESASAMQATLIRDSDFRDAISQKKRLFDVVVDRLSEINLIRDAGGDTMSVLAKPQLGKQVAPNLVRVILGSIFLGGLAGCLVAWTLDRSERTFRSASEIRQALGIPVVGKIPLLKRSQQVTSPAFPSISPIVCTVHQESTNLAEAFRGVRTSLYFSTAGQNHKVIQVTSPLPGDGKSTIVANMAVAIAKSGKSVLVIDADFRRPSMHKLLGKSRGNDAGLAAVVAGKIDPIDAAMRTEIDNLYFMPAGQRPHNPSELLSTPEFKELLDVLRERYEFVIVDTPPILAVTDPCAVAAQVDGVLLTIRLRKGVQIAALRAKEMLNGLEANILGVIVNGVEKKFGYGSNQYGYSYGYGLYADKYGSHEGETTKAPTMEQLMNERKSTADRPTTKP